MLRAILFDLDDTLLDWSNFKASWMTMESNHISGVVEYLRECGHSLDDLHTFTEAFGKRTYESWEAARLDLRAPNLGTVLQDTAHEFGIARELFDMRACLEAYHWGPVDGTVIFPDVLEVLQALRDLNIQMGIITNAYQPMWMRDLELTAFGLLDLFPTCRFSAADVGWLKPHPAIFQAALDCLGTKPEETVFVGDDLEADIAGAQAAGLHAVMRQSRHSVPRFRDHVVPDAVIQSLTELPSILDNWFPGWRLGV